LFNRCCESVALSASLLLLPVSCVHRVMVVSSGVRRTCT